MKDIHDILKAIFYEGRNESYDICDINGVIEILFGSFLKIWNAPKSFNKKVHTFLIAFFEI